MRRVNEALREVLSARIADGLKDPRIGFVTVTAVETSPDLRHARVYVSVLGNDSIIFMSAPTSPRPHEYQHLPLQDVRNEPPPDMDERTAVFLDCGNIDRMPVDFLQREGQHILNIDHHHDNTRFGTVNLVVPEASCTAEIVWGLMGPLGVRPTRTVAEALYVGLITDPGRFMYENTGRQAHVMAADLIDAGVDVHEMYRR